MGDSLDIQVFKDKSMGLGGHLDHLSKRGGAGTSYGKRPKALSPYLIVESPRRFGGGPSPRSRNGVFSQSVATAKVSDMKNKCASFQMYDK